MVCDVLAGDRGPSCRSVNQIPDTKVIHVRFIESVEVDGEDADAEPEHKKMRIGSPLNSLSTCSGFAREQPQRHYPKSLSISKMLKLGKTIEETSTSIEIFPFNMEEMSWSTCGEHADFSVAKEPFAAGGFREAYKASSNSVRFKANAWVVKKYLSHFSFEKSDKKLMVVDIQGSGCNLYDPEIASTQLLDNGKVMFCAGNLSNTAIEKFTMDHQCNKYCKLVGLHKL